MPSILVYVVFHRHWLFVEECLSSIRANLDDIEFDVVVINTTESASDLKELKCIANEYPVINIPKSLPLVLHQVYIDYLDKYDFIMRLDADDFLQVGAVKGLFDRLVRAPYAGAAYGGWSVVDEHSRLIRVVVPPAESVGLGFHGACTLFRTSSLLGLNFDSIGVDCQDGYATFLHLTVKGIRFVMVDQVIFGYRRHTTNITSDLRRLHSNRRRILNYFYNLLPANQKVGLRYVLIDTTAVDLNEADRQFLSGTQYYVVKDGEAAFGVQRYKIPQDLSLSDYFMQLEPESNFIFFNARKLAGRYAEGMLMSFSQFVTIMRPRVATYVEPITNRVLLIDNDGSVKALNVEGNVNRFCFTELNGLHALMQNDFVRDYAMYSDEILTKIVDYEF